MRTWHVYMIRPRFGTPGSVRAYTDWGSIPDRWRRRSKYLGTIPAPTRRMAEVLAVVVGWKRDNGRLPPVAASVGVAQGVAPGRK